MKDQGGQRIYPLLLDHKDKDIAKSSVYRHFDSLSEAVSRYGKLGNDKKTIYKKEYEKLLRSLNITNMIIKNMDIIFKEEDIDIHFERIKELQKELKDKEKINETNRTTLCA